MKKFLIFLIVVAAGYFAYTKFFKEENAVTVKDQMTVSKQTNWDYEHQSVTPTGFTATITGVAKNISDYPVKNINIVYKVSTDSAKVFISSLAPGQEYKFTTNCRSKKNNPPYKIERINYEK